MQKMKRLIAAAFCVWAVFGWWGALYPALAMPPDTYRVIDESAAKEALPPWNFDGSPYFDILRAEPGKVHFKSKLWIQLEKLYAWQQD